MSEMPPGSKKRGSARREVDDKSNKANRKNVETDKSTVLKNKESRESDVKKVEETLNDNSYNVKYSKRAVKSNWDRYNEPMVDKNEDVKRGADFEVLLSYSGGSGSQLHLREEQDWEKAVVETDNIVLDLDNLSKALKCIPFHIRLGLSEDIFDSSQISQFVKASKKNNLSFSIEKKNSNKALQKNEDFMPADDSSLNIIEGYNETDVWDGINIKPVIEEKTENLIESLASCLSLKAKNDAITSKKNDEPEKSAQSQDVSDDLDFLLSLSVPSKSLNSAGNENKKRDNTGASVDDWLKSVLDD